MQKKLYLTFIVATTFCATMAVADDAAVNAKYEKSCKVCHEAGLMGAPKTGDVAAWAPRLEKGNEVLLKHINEGFNAMPPKGLCADCSNEEYLKIVEKMSK